MRYDLLMVDLDLEPTDGVELLRHVAALPPAQQAGADRRDQPIAGAVLSAAGGAAAADGDVSEAGSLADLDEGGGGDSQETGVGQTPARLYSGRCDAIRSLPHQRMTCTER